MKYIIISSTLFLSILFAEDNTTVLKVDGMMCSYSCAGKVSTVVQNMKGVKDCSVDFEKGVATVVYDDKKVVEKDILEGLNKETSYKVSLVDSKSSKKVESKI
jgi:copper chaperone CopZ|tara:strand:+ start:637 stop:945 length:309 start_codon:yes stop_codon:yes gene_type:complete